MKKGIYTIEFDMYASMVSRLNIEIRDHNSTGSKPYPDSGPTYGFTLLLGNHHYKTVIDAENSIIMTYCDGRHIKNTPFRIDDLRQFRFTFHNSEKTEKEYIIDNVTFAFIESGAYERKTFMPIDEDVISVKNETVYSLVSGEDRRAFEFISHAADAVAYIDFDECFGADNTVFDFDFKIEGKGKSDKLFSVNFGSGNSQNCEINTPEVSPIWKLGDADIKENIWFNGKYVFDFSEKTYRIYIRNYQNGKTYFAGEYDFSDINSIGRIEFLSGEGNKIFIDTLSVYRATQFTLEIISPKNGQSEATGNISVNTAQADKVFFLINGKVAKEFNASGINTASLRECGVKNGLNELEVIAFSGDNILKKSVKFSTLPENTIPEVELYYKKDNQIYSAGDRDFLIPEGINEMIFAFTSGVENMQMHLEDKSGNVISDEYRLDGKKHIVSISGAPEGGQLIYAVIKKGCTIGGNTLTEDIYYPVFVSDINGLCVTDIINYATGTQSNIIYKYINSSPSQQKAKVFYAEYENREKLGNIEIKEVYFEMGKGEKTDIVSKKTDNDFVKVFRFGKGIKPLR